MNKFGASPVFYKMTNSFKYSKRIWDNFRLRACVIAVSERLYLTVVSFYPKSRFSIYQPSISCQQAQEILLARILQRRYRKTG